MNAAAANAAMSPMVLLAVLLALAVFALLRGLRRQWRVPRSAGAAPAAATRGVRPPQSRLCPICAGFGFTTRMQPKTETRSETQTEFYTDFSGRPATRTVTRPRTVIGMQAVRVACGSCGGSGRVRS